MAAIDEKLYKADARKTSRQIDGFLSEEKKRWERRQQGIHILLLGQSESGKSSVLKNFHLAFAPKSFQRERELWRSIIHLNVLSTIKSIFDIIKLELEPEDKEEPEEDPEELDSDADVEFTRVQVVRRRVPLPPDHPLHETFAKAKESLATLLFAEDVFAKALTPERAATTKDICVRVGGTWKALLGRGGRRKSVSDSSLADSLAQMIRGKASLPPDANPAAILEATKGSILELWQNKHVQKLLKSKGLFMQYKSGFFLNDISRIANPTYLPTDADIIRARVRTMGVEEHRVVIEKGMDAGAEVYITDVGGSRSLRQAWVPYFQGVNCILFLAPLAYNEVLDEDPRVNRLEDSISMWKTICANKLLKDAQIVLFFNKKDVLEATIAAGIQVKKFIPSYDQPNDVESVTAYFKHKFHVYMKRKSPIHRHYMCYQTSAIDTSSMKALLVGVREALLRQQLKNIDVL